MLSKELIFNHLRISVVFVIAFVSVIPQEEEEEER